MKKVLLLLLFFFNVSSWNVSANTPIVNKTQGIGLIERSTISHSHNTTLSSKTYSGSPTYFIKLKDTLNAIIMLGQSNMEGGVNTALNATYLGYQNTNSWYKTDSTFSNAGTITSFNYSVTSNWRTSAATYVGPDCSVGYSYYNSTGKKLMIIKYALGGSALVDDGVTTTTAGLWQVGADYTRANGILHYKKLVNNFLIPLFKHCESRGIKLNILATFWCQGESDAGTTQYRADNYETTLITFFDSLNLRMQPYNVMSPFYKPVITRIHNRFFPVRVYSSQIRTALVNVANHYNSYWIDGDRFALYSDSVHWTPAGQVNHGLKMDTILQQHFR